MKKVYTLFAMLLIAGVTMAQIQPKVDQLGNKVLSSKSIKTNHSTPKTIIDTAGLYSTYTPQFAVGGTVSQIGMIDASNNHMGYWFGTSGPTSTDSLEADYWAQCYVSNGAVKIAGVLFYAAGKAVMVGGASSVVTMAVQTMIPYVSGASGCITDYSGTTYTYGPSPSGTNLASGSMTVANIDTNFLNFNYIPFATKPSVTTDFCLVSNFKAIRVNGDTAWMWCDADGEGLAMNYSQYCVDPTGYYWVSCKASTLDRNISMFAVIDDGLGGIDESFFQGIKMSVRNNLGSDNTYVDYYLQYPSSVKLFIYDISGKLVQEINDGSQSAGNLHTINLNTCNLKSGNYFASLTADGRRLTKKFVIE